MLHEAARHRLDALKAQAQFRVRRVAHSPTATHQRVDEAGSQLLFCSNDYLGLASDERVIEATIQALRTCGVGSGGSHLISGHHAAHDALEHFLADGFARWIPQAQALSFSTGYMANLAVVTGLVGLVGADRAAVFSDALNHASLIDACRLSRAALTVVPHADVSALDQALAHCTAPLKLIVSDGVFSMDGDTADLQALLRLAERHDAWLVIDDAHGVGVLGAQGWGLPEASWPQGLSAGGERLVLVGTLGKSVGVAGAYIVATADILQALLQTARSYIFTTAAPPALAHACLASLRLVMGPEGAQRRQALQARLSQWKAGVQAWGPRDAVLLPSDTPIQPLRVGSNARALAWAQALEAQGLRVPAIRPPTVPLGSARLRITLCATHTAQDVQRLLDALGTLQDREDLP